jgi:hypothetical protein
MLREAADLWAGLGAARGISGRDALWEHPDLLPTAEDLENPDAFVRGTAELDISDLENPGDAADPGDARDRRDVPDTGDATDTGGADQP